MHHIFSVSFLNLKVGPVPPSAYAKASDGNGEIAAGKKITQGEAVAQPERREKSIHAMAIDGSESGGGVEPERHDRSIHAMAIDGISDFFDSEYDDDTDSRYDNLVGHEHDHEDMEQQHDHHQLHHHEHDEHEHEEHDVLDPMNVSTAEVLWER